MNNLFLLTNVLIYLSAIVTFGSLLASFLHLKYENKVEKIVIYFASGSILFSYLFHVLGALNILYSKILLLVYFAFGIVGIFITTYRYLSLSSKDWGKIQLQKSTVLFIVLLTFILFPLIPYLFLYPASWDVLAYHLAIPKFYLQQHSLEFARWFDQTGFPIGIEALYGFGEALHEPRISNFIHFSFIVALILYISLGIKYLFSREVRYLATLVFLFQPMLYTEVALSAYVDYPLAFFTLLTVMLFLKFYKKPTKSDFLLLLLYLFYIPLIKFSGILVVIPLVILIAMRFFSTRMKPNLMFKLFTKDWLFIEFTTIPLFFWLAKNFYYTKNPFYPFYNDIFRGLGYQEGMKQLLKDDILKNSFVTQMIKNFITTNDSMQDYTNLAAILFIFLGLIAILFFLKSKNLELKILSRTTLMISILLLLAIGPITRYVFLIFPLLSLFISELIFAKSNLNNIRKIVMQSLFSLFFIILIFTQIESTFFTRQKIYSQVHKRHWLNFMNYQTAKSMLYEQDNQRVHEYVNSHLSKGEKVLQLLDNRIYYLDVPVAFANTIGGAYFTDDTMISHKDAYERIIADGFTHVIKLDAWGAHPVMRQEIFNGFMQDYVEPVASEAGVTLYKIKK